MISLAEAVTLLKLTMDGVAGGGEKDDLVPTDVCDINIMCPACSPRHNNRRATLNLDFDKNLFNCPRCKFGGKVEDLISFYTNWEPKTVETRIRKGELGVTSLQTGSFKGQEGRGEPISLLAELNQRHETYAAMLDMLTLSDRHKESLMKRGLSEEQIEQFGYKSTPLFVEPTSIPKKLLAEGHNLNGVPGFGLNSAGIWSTAKTPNGFFVPGRNAFGLIQGFQIRADNPSDRIPRYGYFSSKKMSSAGVQCSTWCHWAGPALNTLDSSKMPFDVLIIEGWLKGDVCYALTGSYFLCVPGVSAIGKVFDALTNIKKRGYLRDVYIAYDMDSYENSDVAKQLIGLFYLLKKNGYNVKIMQWNKEFKGLDDWLSEDWM